MATARFCDECGEALVPGKQFCAACGEPMGGQSRAVAAPPRRSGVQGCASAIAGLILFGIGLFLLAAVTPLGLLYFGILVVIALVRVMTR